MGRMFHLQKNVIRVQNEQEFPRKKDHNPWHTLYISFNSTKMYWSLKLGKYGNGIHVYR